MRDLTSQSITDEVLDRLKNTPSDRLRGVLSLLVLHLHNFVREAAITEAEWMFAIDFLTRTGNICTPTRQEVVLLSDTLGVSQLVVSQNHGRSATASEQTVFGPFYVPEIAIRPHGYDISAASPGTPLHVRATVLSGDRTPLRDVLVEVWHADEQGGYDTQDPAWTPAGARFRGNFMTDGEGQIRFWTTMPSSYPIPMDGPVGEMMTATWRSPMRPAHLHFRIEHPGFDTLVTHVFDDRDPYLDSDAVFGVLSSCLGHFEEHPAGLFEGRRFERPFNTLQREFVLDWDESGVPATVAKNTV